MGEWIETEKQLPEYKGYEEPYIVTDGRGLYEIAYFSEFGEWYCDKLIHPKFWAETPEFTHEEDE